MKKLLLAALLFSSFYSSAQNSSVAFNGASQYISVPDNNAIDLSGAFTLETWIYPTGVGSDGTQGGIIINKENSYEIARFADGTVRYALSANGVGNDWAWINTGLVTPLNTWSHIALTKAANIVTVYLNGAASFTSVLEPVTLTANTQELRLGYRVNGGQYLNSRLDELRIWNIARTQAEIKSTLFNKNLSNAATGLVAYYRMNEGSGANAANSCTNVGGINGTLVNTPSWIASPVQFSANAISFDGTDDVVNVADDNTLDIIGAITIEAWVYATNNVNGIQNVVSKSSNAQNNGYIFPRTDNAWGSCVAYLHIAGGFRTISATYPSLNAWHHLAVTHDGFNMRLYINGALANTVAQSGLITVNSNALTFGNQTGFSEYFGGAVNDVRIWNIARTGPQILSNMNTELNPSTQIGLVSYYTFNQGIIGGANTGLTTVIDYKGNNNGVATNFNLSGAASNMIAQQAGLTVLPVTWMSFVAQRQQDKTILHWTTANEQNNDRYIIQHSSNGIAWNNIGSLQASINTSTEKQYSFTHNTPVSGVNYYRIVQKDLDGHSSYSKVVSLLFSDKIKQLLVYPNPVTNGILNIQLEEAAMVSIYNYAGVLVWNKKLPAGPQPVDISRFSNGLYQLKSGNELVRLVVQ